MDGAYIATFLPARLARLQKGKGGGKIVSFWDMARKHFSSWSMILIRCCRRTQIDIVTALLLLAAIEPRNSYPNQLRLLSVNLFSRSIGRAPKPTNRRPSPHSPINRRSLPWQIWRFDQPHEKCALKSRRVFYSWQLWGASALSVICPIKNLADWFPGNHNLGARVEIRAWAKKQTNK